MIITSMQSSGIGDSLASASMIKRRRKSDRTGNAFRSSDAIAATTAWNSSKTATFLDNCPLPGFNQVGFFECSAVDTRLAAIKRAARSRSPILPPVSV